ncbi:FUSC family protein [Vallitalea okinawensis]|uniref:FUSC family protein n=1 Tax=Vallitalea okinawensis TaxID=2078660 RepID=UPI000CFAA68A|nr:aromatic acid exporter family protein [Vallitalea okinawensis]
MSKTIHMFKLKAEANLFDANAYIAKTFFAIATAYLLAKQLPLVSKDMISVLFGLMLTLEPVTLTGIRNGIEQVYATLIGAIVTAIIVSIFGINVLTIAVSVSFTLFVCLRINWKAVSPVAIFTSIYMTQYVQLNELGDPSMMLTFRLRVLALGLGVGVAIIYNFLFAMISYKRMKNKRISYVISRTAMHIDIIKAYCRDEETMVEEKSDMAQTFNDIDWLHALLEDMKLDDKLLKAIGIDRHGDLELLQKIAMYLREINHLTYDIIMVMKGDDLTMEQKNHMEEITTQLKYLYRYFNKDTANPEAYKMIYDLDGHDRITIDINDIIRNLRYICETLCSKVS